MGVIPNLLVSGVGLGAILGLLAFGFALSYWPSRQFHFAYAGVVVAASYTYWSLTSHGISWIIGLVVTLIVSAVLGVACYALVYRRLTDSGAVFLSGFALSLIVSNAIEWGFGSVPSLVQPPFASLGNVVELGGPTVLAPVEQAIIDGDGHKSRASQEISHGPHRALVQGGEATAMNHDDGGSWLGGSRGGLVDIKQQSFRALHCVFDVLLDRDRIGWLRVAHGRWR